MRSLKVVKFYRRFIQYIRYDRRGKDELVGS